MPESEAHKGYALQHLWNEERIKQELINLINKGFPLASFKYNEHKLIKYFINKYIPSS